MQITSNYQILPNRNKQRYFNNQRNQGGFQYPVQNRFSCKHFTDVHQKNTDQISFTARPDEMQLKKAAEEIFNRSIVFGPREYKSLSQNDLFTLVDYQSFFKDDYYHSIGTIRWFAKLFSDGIHRKYPNGFILVAIGRSPAFLAKYLEFQGEDVKYCPISNISSRHTEFSPAFVQAYKKYLDSIGLTADLARTTKKTIVITDYKFSGGTWRNFLKLLGLPEIDIESGEKVVFRDIADIVSAWTGICNFPQETYRWLFDETMAEKRYTSIPRINAPAYKAGSRYEEEFNKYYQNGNRFEENFDTKMMNFILAQDAKYKRCSPKTT